MSKFNMEDFECLERWPTSPGNLRNKVSQMLLNSHNANCKVDAVNRMTGEYRIVIQGMLDKDESKWDTP
jgi:hypothetical protein